MADLNMDECDHLIGIWKICFRCETTITMKQGGHNDYMYGCSCLSHHNCPVPRVRENHSCSLEFKQQVITNYVKKTFCTDDVRGAYKRYMECNCLSLINEMNSWNLTKEECNLLMWCWRICCWCETKVEGNSDQSSNEVGWIWPCQCLLHSSSCPVPHVRESHPPSTCSLQLNTEIVTNYVRKTYETDNVRIAFKTYMKQNLPGLVAEEKPDEKTVRIVELEKENTKNLQELTEARRLCEELRRKLENEKQSNVEELSSIRKKLSDTTAKLMRSEGKQKKSDLKCKDVQVVCDHLNEQNSKLEIENERLKNEKLQETQRIEQVENEKQDLIQKQNETKEELDKTTGKLAKLSYEIREMKKKWAEVRRENCADFEDEESDEDVFEESDECMFDYEWDNFKLHFKELEKKVSDLGQRSFATRNGKLIGEVSRKITPTVEISTRVKEEVVEVLKKGGSELKDALDDLLPLESQFPTSSSKKKKEHPDVKLLE